MQVYKFGGTAVKDANGIKNLVAILKDLEVKNIAIVISAMGKTTNALEDVVNNYFKDKTSLATSIQKNEDFHHKITSQLFPVGHPVFKQVQNLLTELKEFITRNKSPQYDFVYDQIVCHGELLSTTIISQYLKEKKLHNTWLDARELIKTDSRNREARVIWDKTQNNIKKAFTKNAIYITQGFIASNQNNFTTTLGREGSDYTGGILAYCLGADSLTIWKDVLGVLNGDPRVFENTQLLHKISYEEAIELAFFGASIIHPRTLQPLQKKEIPLFVKSFIHPKEKGTTVDKGDVLVPNVPCYILKKDQVLLSLSSLDFSFMMEDTISEIFKLFSEYKIKVNLIQNSAISFSACVDIKFDNLAPILKQLKAKFKVHVNEGVSLYTIRHFTDKVLRSFEKDKTVLLKQETQKTVQLVTLH